MKKQAFLGVIGIFLLISGIPVVNGAEKDVYLSSFSHFGFYLSLEEGFDLDWEYETYNNSFLATVRIDDSEGSYTYLATTNVEGSGIYTIPKTDKYYITLWNQDPGMINGYIRFTYNEPPLSIPSFMPLLLMGIIALTVLLKCRNIVKKRSNI